MLRRVIRFVLMVVRVRARVLTGMHAPPRQSGFALTPESGWAYMLVSLPVCPCSRKPEVVGLIHSHELHRHWHARGNAVQQRALPKICGKSHFLERASRARPSCCSHSAPNTRTYRVQSPAPLGARRIRALHLAPAAAHTKPRASNSGRLRTQRLLPDRGICPAPIFHPPA